MPSPDRVRPDACTLPPADEAHARAILRRALLRGARDEQSLHETTSRLSPYLRFGVLSALEVAERAALLPEGVENLIPCGRCQVFDRREMSSFQPASTAMFKVA
jgi:hypothetical protein